MNHSSTLSSPERLIHHPSGLCRKEELRVDERLDLGLVDADLDRGDLVLAAEPDLRDLAGALVCRAERAEIAELGDEALERHV